MLLLPAAAGIFFLVATLFYYRGNYEPPAANKPAVEDIIVQFAPSRGFDEVLPSREGFLLVDDAHFNDFEEQEINILLARVADMGFTIEILNNRENLAPKLEDADSFLVIIPRRRFDSDEAAIVADFVSEGGKLLLIGDPGRTGNINSLARVFGILFQPGYLYNVAEHDLNFKNIFVRDFRPDGVTQGLRQVVLYNSGPVRSSGLQLALTDSNTFSSQVERTEPFSPIVKSSNQRVLAISDLTFMISPNNAAWDNERLIANLADYLTQSERLLFD